MIDNNSNSFRQNTFWHKAFFFLLPILSNLKIFPNTVFDLLLGIVAVLSIRKPIQKCLLLWVMAWMSAVYFCGLFLEPAGSNAFLSCLRYLMVAGIVIGLNGNIAFNHETARFYILGTLAIAGLFVGTVWIGYHLEWEVMWMQKKFICGPSFLSFTIMAGFSLSLIFWRDYPRTYVTMLSTILFIAPIMESRVLEWFSFFIIPFSLVPIYYFFNVNRALFILSIAAILLSMFCQTPILKGAGLWPWSIEEHQINPLLRIKERISHDLVSAEFDQDRKGQVKRIFGLHALPDDLIGRGGMQHQKNGNENFDPRSCLVTRPVGGLVQKYDGGIVLVLLTFLLFLTSLIKPLISIRHYFHWKCIYLIFFLSVSYSLLFITNPTGSLQWWLFLAPKGFLFFLFGKKPSPGYALKHS